MKTLHVLRHAKSDWSDVTLSDHDRPLNGRGRKARKLIAAHVKGWPVDLVVCSTAERARATAAPVVEALGCAVRFEPAVYDASSRALLEVVQGLPDDAVTAMLVGHNPGCEDLTTLLTGASPIYPTAGLGTITLAVERWTDVVPGSGQLHGHVTPAGLLPSDP